jgi:valyl-tRNA synthetase
MQRVPRSQRGGEVIEPMVSAQWFVKMDNMAAKAVAAVREKDIKILPERFEKVWYNWLENIHDWCISRQLWWGHRIPVYYPSGPKVPVDAGYIVARSAEEAQRIAVEKYGDSVTLHQDGDVLDTWFRSVGYNS